MAYYHKEKAPAPSRAVHMEEAPSKVFQREKALSMFPCGGRGLDPPQLFTENAIRKS